MRKGEFRSSTTSRTAVLYSGLFVVASLLTLSVLYFAATRDLKAQIREAVQQDVRELSEIYKNKGRDALVNDIDVLSSSVEAKRSLYLVEANDGTVLTGNVSKIDPFEDWRELKLPLTGNRSDHFFVYGVRLGDLWLFVGRRGHTVWEIQKVILRSFTWGLCLAVPIAFLGVVVLTRQSSRRVDAIATAMDDYVRGDLSRRVPQTQRGDEIDRLGGNINNVLRQVEKLIGSMKQVTSDVAHDLRTPLSRLRQRLEAAKDDPDKASDSESLAAAIQEIDGILATFDALLQIAEIDAGAKASTFSDVDLSELGQFLSDTYTSVAEDNAQTLDVEIAAGVLVRGNRRMLIQLLVNLIENAIRHSPQGTRIKLAIAIMRDQPCVVVSDTGPGIPEGERERVVERFYRLDHSRSTPGNGLGLALVKSIAELHGAILALSDNAPGLVVTVAFPGGVAA